MAIGKDTGKGLVTIDYGASDPLNPWPVKKVLFHNFNFDGDELKPEHKEQADIRLVPQMLKDKQVIRISGIRQPQGRRRIQSRSVPPPRHFDAELSEAKGRIRKANALGRIEVEGRRHVGFEVRRR